MRRRIADLHGRVNGNLKVEFTEEGLTSHAGMELLIRYVRWIGMNERIRYHLGSNLPGGDFGTVAICRTLLGLLIVGGRHLRHIGFLKGDPVFERFCGLKVLPTDRTLSNWLKDFRAKSVDALSRLNADLIAGFLSTYLTAKTLTFDIDGSVLPTGLKVGWAFRGYNPHHRKVPSYYPISACLAESGHVFRMKNRPGNVNDGKASLAFLRELFRQIKQTFDTGYELRFRMDGAYFKREVLQLVESRKARYALKVPFWRCLDLQGQIRGRKRWKRVQDDVAGFFTTVSVNSWGRKVRVCIFRKRVYHPTRKNYQLDLFDPDDGTWEYSAVATNLSLRARALWRFMCGRGAHEKAIGELKSGLALDSIPTDQYGANSAWQQLVVLAHNLLVNFQIETGAVQKPQTQKRTTLWVIERVRTLRFKIFNRAGRLVRPYGVTILRMSKNQQAKKTFLRIAENLAKAA